MAAIQGKADSVYFGLGKLNMRSRSSVNFSAGDLHKIMRICRQFNKKAYLTLNIIVYDKELDEMKRAVESGYWHLYRFNPDLKKDGQNPFSLDSKEPTRDLKDFLRGESRYASLEIAYPDHAEELFNKAEADANERLESYKKLAQSR
jgi:hypothetical protein